MLRAPAPRSALQIRRHEVRRVESGRVVDSRLRIPTRQRRYGYEEALILTDNEVERDFLASRSRALDAEH
jgi:hypothetical protein